MRTIIYPPKHSYSHKFFVFIFLTFNPESRQISHIFRCLRRRPRTENSALQPNVKAEALGEGYVWCARWMFVKRNCSEEKGTKTPEKHNFFYQMKFNTKYFITKIYSSEKFLPLSAQCLYSNSPVLVQLFTLSREQYLCEGNMCYSVRRTVSQLTFLSFHSRNSNEQQQSELLTFISPGSHLILLSWFGFLGSVAFVDDVQFHSLNFCNLNEKSDAKFRFNIFEFTRKSPPTLDIFWFLHLTSENDARCFSSGRIQLREVFSERDEMLHNLKQQIDLNVSLLGEKHFSSKRKSSRERYSGPGRSAL